MERRSRIVLFAIPVIVVLVGLVAYEYGFDRARQEMVSIRERQEAKTRVLEKYISMISEKPILEAKLNSLKERRKTEDLKIIEAETPSLAAATLQGTVKGIISARGGTISSERVEKTEDLGKFRVVTVGMDIVLPDARALGDVIYTIETRTPYIIVKELEARVKDFRAPRELMVKLRIAALTSGK